MKTDTTIKNKTLISGIIKNVDFNSNILNIIRPVAELSVFDPVKKEWVDHIYIIFSENGDARRFKGFNIGDVIIVSGETSFITGVGYVVYVLEYTILYKNKNVEKASRNKIILSDGCNQQNFIYIKGRLIYYDEDTNIATITHDIIPSIRGNLDKKTTFPVKVLNSIFPDCEDCIFQGRFTSHYIEGEMYAINDI